MVKDQPLPSSEFRIKFRVGLRLSTLLIFTIEVLLECRIDQELITIDDTVVLYTVHDIICTLL